MIQCASDDTFDRNSTKSPIRKVKRLRLASQGLFQKGGFDAPVLSLTDDFSANHSHKAIRLKHIAIPLDEDTAKGYCRPRAMGVVLRMVEDYRRLNHITVRDTLEYHLLKDLEDVIHSYIGFEERAASHRNLDIHPLTQEERRKFIYPISGAIGRQFTKPAKDGCDRQRISSRAHQRVFQPPTSVECEFRTGYSQPNDVLIKPSFSANLSIHSSEIAKIKNTQTQRR
jgi:hypothetical protein